MRSIITLLLLLSATVFSYAQSDVKFGVKAGVNFATIGGEANQQLNQILEWTNGYVSTTGRTGMHVGGFVQIPISETVVIEPGLMYSTKGYTLKGDVDLKVLDLLGIGAKADLMSQYLDMPVLIKATLGNGFQIYAGPQISYLMNADLRTRASVLGVNLLNKKFDVTDQFNKIDAALTAGIGYEFRNGVAINAGYDYGLSRIDANKSVNARNQAVKIGMSLKF
ncbi:PorT family protein [Flavihumibacter sediminis]|nr:PorT family protein [Flavihumibacter sediminis]